MRETDLAALDNLTREERVIFLGRLAFELGIAGRNSYVEAGRSEQESVKRLHAINEMILVVASQLIALLTTRRNERSKESFLASLEHWASHGGCEPETAAAVSQALRKIDDSRDELSKARPR